MGLDLCLEAWHVRYRGSVGVLWWRPKSWSHHWWPVGVQDSEQLLEVVTVRTHCCRCCELDNFKVVAGGDAKISSQVTCTVLLN